MLIISDSGILWMFGVTTTDMTMTMTMRGI